MIKEMRKQIQSVRECLCVYVCMRACVYLSVCVEEILLTERILSVFDKSVVVYMCRLCAVLALSIAIYLF